MDGDKSAIEVSINDLVWEEGMIGGLLKFIGGVVVVLVVIGFLVGDDDFAVSDTPTGGASSAYTISELKGVNQGSGFGKVTGALKNNTSRDLTYVQVEINLFDSSGAQVGSTLANVNNLAAGGLWRFEAVTFQEFSRFEVADVTGF